MAAKKLSYELVFRFSPLEQLHFDQKREFESEVITEICKLLVARKSSTTPYHQNPMVFWRDATENELEWQLPSDRSSGRIISDNWYGLQH